MADTTKIGRKSKRDIAYYRTRYKNRVHAALLAFVVEEMKRLGLNQKQIAERIDREPAQLSRWLSKPSNLCLESISDLLLALDAEPQPLAVVRFSEIRNRQYAHPLIAKATGVEAASNFEIEFNEPGNALGIYDTATSSSSQISASALNI